VTAVPSGKPLTGMRKEYAGTELEGILARDPSVNIRASKEAREDIDFIMKRLGCSQSSAVRASIQVVAEWLRSNRKIGMILEERCTDAGSKQASGRGAGD